MPRPLVLGNGSFLVCIDPDFCIRDLFYPRVGHPNHLNGHPINMGVWVDGEFEWCNGSGWGRALSYLPGTLVGKTTLNHEGLGIELEVHDAVPPHQPVFVRRVAIRNLKATSREVRLFFTHDLRINESDVGDTAFFNPFLDAVVHYKERRYFGFSGSTSEGGIYQYATGIKDFAGMVGTWKDAEDGELSGNPIAQGSVDSTFSIRVALEPEGSVDARYWILCGKSLEDLTAQSQKLAETGFDQEIEETGRYWRAWSSRHIDGLSRLGEDIESLFNQSLLIIRSQIDNGGAVIAANDTDIMKTNRSTYSYMWPRDGAFVSSVLDRVGFQQHSRRFFRFCKQVLPKDRPVLLHKYGADGSLGASWHPWIVDGQPEVPFQEDETALTLHSLWDHFAVHRDLEFLGEMFDDYVVPTADFMNRFRDPETGLPLPSYDLWEERRGVHTFTVGTVAAGLRAAAQIARALGDLREQAYAAASDEVITALEKYLFDEQRGVYYRRVEFVGDKLQFDYTIDSSILSLINLGILPDDSDRLRSSVKAIESALRLKAGIDGVARYEGDYYFRESDQYPGNPWIICTMWLAQAKIRLATKPEDLLEPMDWLKWAVQRAASTWVLPEQCHPETGEPLSVSPLTWSHAEFVATVLDYIEMERAFSG